MGYFQSISFLPDDQKNQAIQNLGQTLGAINQAKIAEQQRQIDEFKNLMDVSLEGVLMNHQEEVVNDMNEFKKRAADIYKTASDNNGRPNYKDITTLNTMKKNLLYKVNYSRNLLERSKEAAIMYARNPDKYDPAFLENMNAWTGQKTPISETVDPMSFLSERYDWNDFLKSVDTYIGGRRDKAEKATRVEGNKTVWRYTPDQAGMDAADVWKGMPDKAKNLFRSQMGITGNGQAEFVKFAQNRYSDYGEKANSKSTTNVYPPGYQKNWVSPYLLADNKITFKSGTGGNLLLGQGKTGVDGTKVPAGTLFEPNYIYKKPNGQVVVAGATKRKKDNTPFSMGDWETNAEGKLVPKVDVESVSVEIPYDQLRTDIIVGYGQPVGVGQYDFAEAEKYVGYGDGSPVSVVATQPPPSGSPIPMPSGMSHKSNPFD